MINVIIHFYIQYITIIWNFHTTLGGGEHVKKPKLSQQEDWE